MKEILTALMIWISANTYYNTDHPLPNVVFLPQEEMNKMYDKEKDIIILPDTWDSRDAWSQGVLVHEMIHYYQDQNKMTYNCTQEMEKDAWPIQQFYLKKVHNYDWDYDQLWYIMISACSDPFSF